MGQQLNACLFVHNTTYLHTTKAKAFSQGYRNRYDIIDHGHEKKPFMYFFHRPISTEIKEFATIV